MDERIGSVISVPDEDLKKKLHRLSVDRFLLPLMLGSSEEQPGENELNSIAKDLEIIKPNKTQLKKINSLRKKCNNTIIQ